MNDPLQLLNGELQWIIHWFIPLLIRMSSCNASSGGVLGSPIESMHAPMQHPNASSGGVLGSPIESMHPPNTHPDASLEWCNESLGPPNTPPDA